MQECCSVGRGKQSSGLETGRNQSMRFGILTEIKNVRYVTPYAFAGGYKING